MSCKNMQSKLYMQRRHLYYTTLCHPGQWGICTFCNTVLRYCSTNCLTMPNSSGMMQLGIVPCSTA